MQIGAFEKPLAKTYIVCGVVLERDGQYLLVQEKKPKVYGKWNLPAGRVDEGETLEQAAIRETKEECGFEVELNKHLLTLHMKAEQPVLHAYAAKIIGGELKFPEDELLDARWFSYSEIQAMREELRAPEYVIGAIDQAQQA